MARITANLVEDRPKKTIENRRKIVTDSGFEISNVSLKENKPDGVNPNSNDIDFYVRKNEGKILWFWAHCIYIYISIIPGQAKWNGATAFGRITITCVA